MILTLDFALGLLAAVRSDPRIEAIIRVIGRIDPKNILFHSRWFYWFDLCNIFKLFVKSLSELFEIIVDEF